MFHVLLVVTQSRRRFAVLPYFGISFHPDAKNCRDLGQLDVFWPLGSAVLQAGWVRALLEEAAEGDPFSEAKFIMEEQKSEGEERNQDTPQHLDWRWLGWRSACEQHLCVEHANAWAWISLSTSVLQIVSGAVPEMSGSEVVFLWYRLQKVVLESPTWDKPWTHEFCLPVWVCLAWFFCSSSKTTSVKLPPTFFFHFKLERTHGWKTENFYLYKIHADIASRDDGYYYW